MLDRSARDPRAESLKPSVCVRSLDRLIWKGLSGIDRGSNDGLE
jgi:hypothetical protein